MKNLRRTLLSTTALLGLLLGLLAPAPAALAGETPAETYRDSVHKFSLKIFKKWAQVPIEPGARFTVAKFMEEGAGRGGYFDPEIEVVRLNKKDGGDTPAVTGPGGQGELPEELKRLLEANEPKTVWDITIKRLNVPEDKLPKQEGGKDIESKDDVPGKYYEAEVEFGSGREATLFVSLATFEKDQVEYGVFMTCAKTQRRKFERGFELVAKSFRFFDDKAEDVESLDVLDGINISAARRRDIEKSMVEGWDVIVSPKKQYIIVYNTKNSRNNPLAKEIARRIEKIREQIYEVQFPPAKPIEAVSVVRVCGDAREYHAYGGPGGSAGYWNSNDEELVFYDASPSRKIDDDTVSVLYHEAFHQYIYYSVGDVAPHSWFNEGHGDYYAGAELKGSKFRIGPFAWRQGTIKNAVVHGPRALLSEETGDDGEVHRQYANDGGYTPLKDLVRFTQREYYSYPGICYAEGWSLIYFLREVVPKNRKYKEKWGKILDTYFDVLQREVNKDPKANDLDDEPPAPPDGPDQNPPEPPTPPTTPPDGDGEGPAPGEPGGSPPAPGEPGGDEEEPGAYLPAFTFGGRATRAALKLAVDEAFKGVDWDEFEEAWAKAVKKDM